MSTTRLLLTWSRELSSMDCPHTLLYRSTRTDACTPSPCVDPTTPETKGERPQTATSMCVHVCLLCHCCTGNYVRAPCLPRIQPKILLYMLKQYRTQEIRIHACYEPRLLLARKRMTLSSLALSCSLPLLTFPKSPAVHMLLLHAHSNFPSPAVLPQSSPFCTIIAAQKITRYRSFKSQPRNRSRNMSTS